MPIFRGSRYEGIEMTGVRGPDGRVRRTLHAREPRGADDLGPGALVHEVQAGEELDLLALRYGGKSRLWWLLADVNGIMFPLDLPPGTRLVIPDNQRLREAP